MRALITGINGFVGGHLAEHLLQQGWQVAGVALSAEIHEPSLRGRVQAYTADLLDPSATRTAIQAAAPGLSFI